MYFIIIPIVIILAFIIIRLMIPKISPMPDYLGVKDGKLHKCVLLRSCINSQSDEDEKPFSYNGSKEVAIRTLIEIIKSQKGAEIINQTENYVQSTFKSALFGFIDDVEFLIDDDNKEIHYRSSSRVGANDWGANKKRIEILRNKFAQKSKI